MKFQILAAAFAATAAAAPSLLTRQTNTTTIGDNEAFGLVALRSGSPVHFASFSAANDGILLNLPSQNASCSINATNDATFRLSDGALYLFTPTRITQQLYTDRSGMGQGVLQYATAPNGYQPGRNSETTGWEIDEAGDLTFDGAGLIACPGSIDGAWSVWVSAGVINPGGNSGCLGISARAVAAAPAPAVNTCIYTYTPVNV